MINNSIRKKIDNASIISFDMFDTIIVRAVTKPKDIMDIVEKRYNSKHKKQIINFKNMRTNAESILRKEKHGEITLNEIYDNLSRIYNVELSICSDLLRLEQQTEIDFCFYNSEIDDIINYCLKKRKNIIITTDMYLDENTISKLLQKTPLKKAKIYLSNKEGCSKSKGLLYERIIEDNNISPKKILHIGDNIKSDYIMAIKKGLSSYRYKRKKHIRNEIDLYLELLLSGKGKNYYYNFGYRYIGLLLYGFCSFIRKETMNNKIDNIIFLAREGKFIKECYDLMFPENNTNYMYISRKSASSSIIYNKKIKYEDIINIQSISLNETVKMFLKRFNLNNDANIELLKNNDISVNDDYRKNSEKIKSLFDKLINNSDEKEDLFAQYLTQMCFNRSTAIVDVGWSGTMQDLINMELSDNKINGYYLGVRKQRNSPSKHGFVFNGDNYELEVFSRAMVAFIEMVFAADHGTTIKYKREREKIIPVLDKCDSPDNDKIIIKDIQQGAKDFIIDMKNECIIDYYNVNKEDYYKNFFDFGINPSLEDIKHFSSIKIFNEKEKLLIGGKKIIQYIKKPSMFKSDFLDSGWKIAFLKNVFRININYSLIYKIIYRIKK